jgi:FkbM family methyltransferase
MTNKFEIFGVEDHGVVHFTYLGGDVQEEYEVSIVDLNTNLIVHKSKMSLKTGVNWWISTGASNAKRLKNAKLRILIGDKYHEDFIRFKGENRHLVLNQKHIELQHNGDELFPIVCEIFYDKVYERDFVRINQGDVVVDIGANYGVFSLYVQQFNPSKVFAMEPIKSTFKCMSDNLKDYGVTCINKAISNEDGFESFAITDVNGNNFSLRHSEGYHPSVMNDAEIVETTTFNTFINDYDIDKIDFLKVDCEGGELDLFETIDTNYLKSSINKIAMEYHSNKIKERVIEILTENGFSIEDTVGMEEIGLIYAFNMNK